MQYTATYLCLAS